MEEFTFLGRTFYLLKEVVENKHPCVKGMAKKPFDFFTRKGMQREVHYLLARKHKTKNIWVSVSHEKYSRQLDKILISEEWMNQFKQLLDAPKVLQLKDHELFRDDEGEPYPVEVRGTRNYKSCYFKAKDVATCFNMSKLLDTISDKRGAYKEGKDYVRFLTPFAGINGKLRKEPELYLTYTGLIRVMMVSRVGCAEHFIEWAMETLFAAHLGTTKQKAKLVSGITGIDYPTVRAFCSTLNTTISAIYLFKLGKVKDLKDILNIPDTFDPNATVYKYGKTNDIQRRFKEHLDQNYSQDKGFDTKLELIWFVDRSRYTEAENDIKEYMISNGYKLDNPIHTEIAIIKGTKSNLSKMLSPIFCEYSSKISDLEHKILLLTHEIELLKKDLISSDELHKSELKAKDLKIELLEAKLELAELRK